MKWIKTKEQARQYGINFQRWASDKNLSYSELSYYQLKLSNIAKKFDLESEFKENGII